MRFRSLLPLPLLALLVLGGTAAPARAGDLPAFALTTSAHVDAYAAPGQSVIVPWFTEDSGADALNLTVRAAQYTLYSFEFPAIAWVTGLSPATFTLTSGQSGSVQVTVAVPAATAPGNYYVNVAALAADAACSANCIGAVVAGTLEVHVS